MKYASTTLYVRITSYIIDFTILQHYLRSVDRLNSIIIVRRVIIRGGEISEYYRRKTCLEYRRDDVLRQLGRGEERKNKTTCVAKLLWLSIGRRWEQ